MSPFADAVERLNSRVPNLRIEGVEALAATGHAEAIPHLIRALNDPTLKVRLAAVSALGQFRDRRAVTALTTAAADPDRSLRTAALGNLARTGPVGVPGLYAGLNDRRAEVRRYAAELLLWMGNPALPALVREVLEQPFLPDEELTQVFAGFGAAAVPYLCKLLRAEAREVRVLAAKVLGLLPERGQVPPLIRLLQDRHLTVRRSALAALGRLRNPEAVPAILDLLEEWKKELCLEAVQALGEIGDPLAQRALCGLLHHRYGEFREAAATALGGCGDRQAVPALVQVLRVKRTDKVVLGNALARISQRDPVPELRQALPLLRPQRAFWPVQDAARLEELEAIVRQIETATEEVKDVPVVAGAAHQPRELPIPGTAVAPGVEALPLPSTRSEQSRRVPGWYARLLRMVRRR